MAVDLPAVNPLSESVIQTQLERNKGRSRRTALYAIGTLIILSDGSECVVAGYDAQGNPLCQPVQD